MLNQSTDDMSFDLMAPYENREVRTICIERTGMTVHPVFVEMIPTSIEMSDSQFGGEQGPALCLLAPESEPDQTVVLDNYHLNGIKVKKNLFFLKNK